MKHIIISTCGLMNTMHNEFKTLSRLVKSTDLEDSDLNSRFVLDLEMDSAVPFSFFFCSVLFYRRRDYFFNYRGCSG